MTKSDAVKHFDSKSKLARTLGLTPASISGWGKVIPAVWAYRLEAITDGVLRADDEWLQEYSRLHQAA